MKIVTTLSLCTLFALYHFLAIGSTLANEWGLEMQPLELDMCDSVILHYDGKTWSPVYHKFNTWLDDIYGFDDNNIFAVGAQGAILHYNGKSWTSQESRTPYRLNKIWGNSPNNIYISGDYGTILRYNGTAWKKQDVGISEWLSDVWGLTKNTCLLWALWERYCIIMRRNGVNTIAGLPIGFMESMATARTMSGQWETMVLRFIIMGRNGQNPFITAITG